MPLSASKPLLIDLALQGGGAHGAFTWGVIDRLLEEPGLQIEGISGTSAGAMNAAVMASGAAMPSAQGQAMISTATARIRAVSRPTRPPNVQKRKVATARSPTQTTSAA